jgi:hypothetical protein
VGKKHAADARQRARDAVASWGWVFMCTSSLLGKVAAAVVVATVVVANSMTQDQVAAGKRLRF